MWSYYPTSTKLMEKSKVYRLSCPWTKSARIERLKAGKLRQETVDYSQVST